MSWRYYCSRACAADNFRSKGQRFADRVLGPHKGLKGLAGDVTRIEKCPTCGKMVPSARMAEHVTAFHPAPRNETREQGVSRIMRIFAELEHLQEHGDPDCPQCKRIRDTTQTFTIIPVRHTRVVLTCGAVTITGTRKRPYNKNAWTYRVTIVRRDFEGDPMTHVVGIFDTTKSIVNLANYSWWHNEGPGYDEGGNNRAAHLLNVLLEIGDITSIDIEGPRSNPLYRVKSSDPIEDEP